MRDVNDAAGVGNLIVDLVVTNDTSPLYQFVHSLCLPTIRAKCSCMANIQCRFELHRVSIGIYLCDCFSLDQFVIIHFSISIAPCVYKNVINASAICQL